MITERLPSHEIIKSIVVDLLVLTAVYFLPAASHMLSVPLHMIEPMRIALIVSIILTNKSNSIIIAFTLPLFAYVISSHPHFYKSLLIGAELSINVYLFYYLLNRFNYVFVSMAASIVFAKIMYYSLKYLFLNLGLLSGSLISTPLYLQLLVTLILSLITSVMFSNRKFSSD